MVQLLPDTRHGCHLPCCKITRFNKQSAFIQTSSRGMRSENEREKNMWWRWYATVCWKLLFQISHYGTKTITWRLKQWNSYVTQKSLIFFLAVNQSALVFCFCSFVCICLLLIKVRFFLWLWRTAVEEIQQAEYIMKEKQNTSHSNTSPCLVQVGWVVFAPRTTDRWQTDKRCSSCLFVSSFNFPLEVKALYQCQKAYVLLQLCKYLESL